MEVVVLLDAVRPAHGVVVPQETLREPQPVATNVLDTVGSRLPRSFYAPPSLGLRIGAKPRLCVSPH